MKSQFATFNDYSQDGSVYSQSKQEDHDVNIPKPVEINSLSAFNRHINRQKIKSNNMKIKLDDNQEIESVIDLSNEPSLNRSDIVFFGKESQYSSNKDQFYEFEEGNSPQKLKGKKAKANMQNSNISLMCPSYNVHVQSLKFLDQTYNQIMKKQFSFSTLQSFLHKPLSSLPDKSFMRYVFEIHSFNFQFTFHSYYDFYLRNSNGEMINILRSEKESLTVSSSHLFYAVNPGDLKSQQFSARLKYNTLKSEYNLYDIDERVQKDKERKILATVFYSKYFGQERQLEMYKPKQEHRGSEQFIKSPVTKNLSVLFKNKQAERRIEKLQTARISEENQQMVREQFELKKEGRRILMEDQQGLEKMYMGKRQDGRYIILAGSGLTPLEIFMLAIVNLDH